MTNKEISRALRLAADFPNCMMPTHLKCDHSIMLLFQIDRPGVQLSTLQPGELTALPGIGKGIASDIAQLLNHGSFNERWMSYLGLRLQV
ncbi:MAG: hypothetical protein R2850_12575 [Bacteroidia bacterium]